MREFDNVVRALREWMLTFPWVDVLLPFSLILMFGGLAISFLYDLFSIFRIYFSLSVFFTTIGHFAFLLGFWLCLISREARYAPYGLFIYAFLFLFPFTGLSIYSVLWAAVFAYLGYGLFLYTSHYSGNNNQG